MPQPGGAGGNSYLPYPAAGGPNFPSYPGASNFGQGGYPPYGNPPASTGGTGYPPYMNQGAGYPPATGGGYNNYYNVGLSDAGVKCTNRSYYVSLMF